MSEYGCVGSVCEKLDSFTMLRKRGDIEVIWKAHIKEFSDILNALSVRDGNGIEMDIDKAFLQWSNTTLMVREQEKTIYLIGNGASASMASHVAADLAKNAQVRTEVFSDLSLITALANDMGYENVFVEPLRRRMCAGDMLVAISSSGQSPNVILAAEEAQRKGGFIVTLSAMEINNKSRSMGMLNFYIPATAYGLAESGHASILHFWIDHVVCGSKGVRE